MKCSRILKNHELLKNKTLSIEELIAQTKKIHNDIKFTNSIITDCCDLIDIKNFKLSDNLLSGSIYSLKDNVSTKNIKTTIGSKFLSEYISPYDATIYRLLKQSGALLTSKNNLDEFAMAGTGLHSGFGYVKNFIDENRIAGGSSSGAVNLVASKAVHFAIGSDTGDSARRPASFLGVVGYKPSYGLISRYGIAPYAPSLDHVGIITSCVMDAAIVAQQICQFDPKDFTSQKLEHNFYKNLKNLKEIKIAVIKDIDEFIQPNERKLYKDFIQSLIKKGFNVIEKVVNYDLMDTIGIVYQVISNVEGLSCYNNFSGIPFGNNLNGNSYEDILLKNRTTFFNNQVKKRFMMGSYLTSLDNFEEIFIRSKKIRTLLIELTNDLLNDTDCFIVPSASGIAPTIDDIINERYHCTHADDALILANFAGLPSITLNIGRYLNMPYGININCKQKHDQKMFDIAYTIENLIGENNE